MSEKIKELTGGKAADVLYDPVGDQFAELSLRARVAWKKMVVKLSRGTRHSWNPRVSGFGAQGAIIRALWTDSHRRAQGVVRSPRSFREADLLPGSTGVPYD
jgi:hypothetical protein